MPLDAASRAALEPMQNMPSLASRPIEEVRRQMAARRSDDPVENVYSAEDISIPGHDSELPARHYKPQPKDGQHLSVLVYFHGGGFVMGGLDSHDAICRALTNSVPCVVVSIDYRLAPEHPFPAAPEDCYAATQWVAAHAGELDADTGLVAVGGDSAGGNLAAAVSILARERQGPKLACQLLYYPCVGPTVEHPGDKSEYASMVEFGPGSEGLLNNEDAVRLMSLYEPVLTDTRFAVIRADLKGLPPALVITCEVDPLRDEGRAYAEKLKAAGVPTEFKQFDGTFHGFLTLALGLPQSAEAMKMSVQALRKAFGMA